MPSESEVIKQQMEQTRASLTDKLEKLEHHVFGKVHETTSAVADTACEVRDSVRRSMRDVRRSLRDTLEDIKEAFNLSHQVQRHPWIMLGGSLAAGYISACAVERAVHDGKLVPHFSLPSGSSTGLPPPSTGRVEEGGGRAALASSGPSFLKSLADTFAPEIAKLKGVALGVTMGFLRDKVAASAPPQMRADLASMFDRITTKLGGEPTPQGSMESEEEKEAAMYSDPRMARMRDM